MDTFFIIVLLFFVAPPILKAIAKAGKAQNPKPKYRPSQAQPKLRTQTRNQARNQTSQKSNLPWNSPEFQDLKQTLQEMTGASSNPPTRRSGEDERAQRKKDYAARLARAKAAEAKQARRLRAHDASHGDTVEKRDTNDKNKNRRADWGARVGPGVLNSKTFITALVMGGVLAFLMAQS